MDEFRKKRNTKTSTETSAMEKGINNNNHKIISE